MTYLCIGSVWGIYNIQWGIWKATWCQSVRWLRLPNTIWMIHTDTRNKRCSTSSRRWYRQTTSYKGTHMHCQWPNISLINRRIRSRIRRLRIQWHGYATNCSSHTTVTRHRWNLKIKTTRYSSSIPALLWDLTSHHPIVTAIFPVLSGNASGNP